MLLVCLNGEEPEHAGLGQEPVDRARWKEGEPPRGLLAKPCSVRRMESKVPRLGLALKRRKATPLHPGGKEVRGRLELLKCTAAAPSGFDSAGGGTLLVSLAACVI